MLDPHKPVPFRIRSPSLSESLDSYQILVVYWIGIP